VGKKKTTPKEGQLFLTLALNKKKRKKKGILSVGGGFRRKGQPSLMGEEKKSYKGKRGGTSLLGGENGERERPFSCGGGEGKGSN